MQNKQDYNLDLHMYSLQDIFELFDLTYSITLEDMKRAKKKVLMTHPDKSKLDAKYFLFYKKAFDIVVKFYENQNKQNVKIPSEKQNYEPGHQYHNKETTQQVSKNIQSMNKQKFNETFNELFDKNMVNKPNIERNKWFTDEAPMYETNENVNNQNMGQIIDKIKDTQSGLIKHRGVENLYMNSDFGNSIYDDETNDLYVSSDPFSKLKFDDIRKVHKDQTVFSVSEKDIHKVQQYSSVDHMMRERGKQSLTPIEKQDAERILAQQNTQYREQIMQKEYADKLKTMQYEEKNKNVLATFMLLKNDK
jgi:hypothetical protein|tara:strand:- start:677 stop:1594 length:918 start_codon:yes stop_codon:yes gene_type:complete